MPELMGFLSDSLKKESPGLESNLTIAQASPDPVSIPKIKFNSPEEERQFSQEFYSKSSEEGFSGGIQYLESKGRVNEANSLRNSRIKLNKSIYANSAGDSQATKLDNLEQNQNLLGEYAAELYQAPPKKRAEAYNIIRPALLEVWPDAPKKFNEESDMMLQIALGQAMPESRLKERKNQVDYLVQNKKEALSKGDLAGADRLTNELTKRNIITDPVTEQMIDLQSPDHDVNKVNEITGTLSVDNANKINKDAPVRPQGIPVTAEFQKERLAEERVPGQFKIPSGYRLKDSLQPHLGVEPIPGGQADRTTMGDAGKVQMMRSAQASIVEARRMFFDEDGSPNWTNITTAQTIPLLNVSGVPKTEGRRARSFMEHGIQAITRLETGAAMPASELENTMARYMPSPLDDEETIKSKLQMFESFISGTLKLIDPAGRFDHKRFDDGLNYVRQGGSINEVISGTMKSREELSSLRASDAKPENSIQLIQASPEIPDELKSAAIEAITNGKKPSAVMKRIKELMKGNK